MLDRVRRAVGQISAQAVYDVLNTLTDRGLLRRIQSAGFAVDEAEVTFWGYCAACADPNTRKP